MTSIASDIDSIISEYSTYDNEADYGYSIMSDDAFDSDDTTTSSHFSTYDNSKSATNNNYTSLSIGMPKPKAIFFNTSIEPVSFKKHHIQVFSDDDSFSTILKEDPMITVADLLNVIKKRFSQFSKQDLIIILRDEKTNIKKVLYDNDRIIKLQNKILRSMWIDEKDLPTAILKYSPSFKFVIHKI